MLRPKTIKSFFKDAEITSSKTSGSKIPDLNFEMPKPKVSKTKPSIPKSSIDEDAFAKQFVFTPDIIVYTDGACIHNGKPNAKAGIGVYFAKDDPRNLSKPVDGKQTNNTAELGAIWEAYKILKKEIEVDKKNVLIYSDSQYAIRCCTTYGSKVAAMNPESEKAKQVPNYAIVIKMYNKFKGLRNVRFQHIRAHTGAQDIHSRGNDEADRLANEAIGVKPGTLERNKKTYLNVPFSAKEEAKFMGAKWDAKKKKWYYEDTISKDKQEVLLEKFGI